MTLHLRPAAALLLAALTACGPDKGEDTDAAPTTDDGAGTSTGTAGHSSDPMLSASDPSAPATTASSPSTADPSAGEGTTDPTTPTVPVTTVDTSAEASSEPDTSGSTFAGETGESSETSETGFDTSEVGGEETPFIVEADVPAAECDIWDETCPAGQKCMPFASGGSGWDSLKCVPIDAEPKQPGQECVVDGSAVSGVDNCDLHSMCFGVGDDLVGKCVPMCTGSEQNPVCDPDSECAISNGGVIILCLPVCDPLLQDCAAGDTCIPVGEKFQCIPDASGQDGQLFDECQFANACEPGLTCLNPELSPDCQDQVVGCCLPFCDVSDPSPTCPNGLDCLAWFEPGQAPPGLEDVGVCGAL